MPFIKHLTLVIAVVGLWSKCAFADEQILWRRAIRGGASEQLVSGQQSIAVSPDGRLLAVWFMASKKDQAAYQLRIWDLSNHKVIFKSPWKVRNDSVVPRASLAFSPDSSVLAVEDFPRLVRLFHIRRADRASKQVNRRNQLPELSLTPLTVLDQDILSGPSSTYTKKIRRQQVLMSIDRRTGAIHSANKSHNAPATAHCGHICFSPCGTKLAVASTLINGSSVPEDFTERVIKLWNINLVAESNNAEVSPKLTADLQHTFELAGYPFDPLMSFSADNQTLTTCHPRSADHGQLGTVNVWDSNTAQLITQSHPVAHQPKNYRANEARPLAISPNGKFTAWFEGATFASLWINDSGQRSSVFSGHTGLPRSGTFSSDGKFVATAANYRSADRKERGIEVFIWETETGVLKSRHSFVDSDSGCSVQYVPGTQSIVIGSYSRLELKAFGDSEDVAR